jgi:hypothetical protein
VGRSRAGTEEAPARIAVASSVVIRLLKIVGSRLGSVVEIRANRATISVSGPG